MHQLHRFFLHVLFWLPVCFAIWYFSSFLFTAPLAWMVNGLMTSLFPTVIEQVRQHGNNLTVITRLVSQVPGDYAAMRGDILFDLNPLTYGYSFPLYTALVLATPAEDAKRARYWIVGVLLLLALQIFGITTYILKTLAFLNLDARTQLGFAPWGYDLVVLVYQFGYLILPPVAPIVLWLWQFQQKVMTLVETVTL